MKEIIVNAETRESRIAVREDGQLVELHIEREERVVGSIYKGRVESVHHGMDAAFVDIGLDRNAYLAVGDVVSASEEETSGASASDAAGGGHDRRGRRPRSNGTITQMVKRGQEILVQVIKAPRGSKGARVSTRISLPGRYLVFMPDEASVGVSRKIEDPKERDRLKRIVEGIRRTSPDGNSNYGLIVRTEAEDKTERELRQDLEYLERTWADIRRKAQVTPAPNLVYADLTLLFRILRDAFGQNVDRLLLDSPADYKRAHELLDFFGPNLKDRVELYDGEKPIFEQFAIEQDIQKMLDKRVWLKSGGYLIIDQAEALVAIDVNSGRFTGSTSGLSDTIVQTNLEAVQEIARQLRLRDMGGILVLDLIDMASAADRKRVEQAFETALKHDKNRCKISHISPLGLLEMTRKRTGETVGEQMTEACPYCDGVGKIDSPDSIVLKLRRDLHRLSQTQAGDALLVRCHPRIAPLLVGEEAEDIEALEHTLQHALYVRVDEDVHQEKYDIQSGKIDEYDRRQAQYRRGQVTDIRLIPLEAGSLAAQTGYTDSGHLVELPEGRFTQVKMRVRINRVGRSLLMAEPLVRGGSESETAPPPAPEARPAAPRGGNGTPPSGGEPVAEGRAEGEGRRRNNKGRNRQGVDKQKQATPAG